MSDERGRVISLRLKLSRNMLCLCLCVAAQNSAQTASGSPFTVLMANGAKGPALPGYLVYRHFLAWVSALDRDSKKKGVTDPYLFAQPFSKSTAFSNQELDVLKTHAKLLEDDLAQQDAKAAALIASYRQAAKTAVGAGRPLPSLPPELQSLQQQKTAMMIHHYIAFRSSLGPQASSKLDVYLAREFAPHISVQSLSSATKKPSPVSAEGVAGFTNPVH